MANLPWTMYNCCHSCSLCIVMKVTSPLFFLYFFQPFFVFKALALLSHDASHDPILTINHPLTPLLPSLLHDYTTHLYDITQAAVTGAPVREVRHTLELLSPCIVMTSCLTCSLSTLNVSYSHYSAHDTIYSHALTFATLLHSCATFHFATSY